MSLRVRVSVIDESADMTRRSAHKGDDKHGEADDKDRCKDVASRHAVEDEENDAERHRQNCRDNRYKDHEPRLRCRTEIKSAGRSEMIGVQSEPPMCGS